MNRAFKRLYSLNDAWTSWLGGEKFPVAFYGDSTIDGNNTTGWVRNEIGIDGASPNAFCRRLQDKLREAAGNTVLRIYNAGFSGQIAPWALDNFSAVFCGDSPYNDVKMVGIGFGINDRLMYPNEKEYRKGFRAAVEGIINRCFDCGIQPFLLTTQAIVEPGVNTVYAVQYPMRTSRHICTVANEVKKELAFEYGLELLDMNLYTEQFLLYSSHSLHSIIPDTLHFEDIGHEYEAGLLFALIDPQTIWTDGICRIDYSNQRIGKSVPEDWLTMPEKLTDCFKVFVNRSRDDKEDLNIFTVYLFNQAKGMLNLRAYKGTLKSGTYIKLDGAVYALKGLENHINNLEPGLHKLEVFTGESELADFKGFLVG